MKKTKIVIVGGGFGGIAAALNLAKNNSGNWEITVVAEHTYHLFCPNLYEVASSDDDLVSSGQLEKSIALPLEHILFQAKINLKIGKATEVNRQSRYVQVGGVRVEYDYLVLALGSETEYFGVPGAQENSLPLKTLPDALRVRNAIEFALQSQKPFTKKRTVRVVVAGGGYTGVEFAAELARSVKFMAWKNFFPLEKFELEIIEAQNCLIPVFTEAVSRAAARRLRELGVHIRLDACIAKVEPGMIELVSGEKVAYDVLVWTTGVRARQIAAQPELEKDAKGRIVTNAFLQSVSDDRVIALGDMALIMNPEGRPVPASAQDAIDQGRYLGRALAEIIKNRKPQPYVPKKHGFIVSLGGPTAVMDYNGWKFKGVVAYFFLWMGHWRYFAGLLGWLKSFFVVFKQYKVFRKNDI